jgi:hypothetical protein
MFVTDFNRFSFSGVDAMYLIRALSIRIRRVHTFHFEKPLQDIRCIRLHYADSETLSMAREHISEDETGSQSWRMEYGYPE